MSVGLLLITHNGLGHELLTTAEGMLGLCPLQTETLAVRNRSNPDQVRQQARRLRDSLDQGDGVLVLTDMYGSTPSNIAVELTRDGSPVAVVAGLSLPMLVRVLNYANLTLDQLAAKALSGGREGVVLHDALEQPGA